MIGEGGALARSGLRYQGPLFEPDFFTIVGLAMHDMVVPFVLSLTDAPPKRGSWSPLATFLAVLHDVPKRCIQATNPRMARVPRVGGRLGDTC